MIISCFSSIVVGKSFDGEACTELTLDLALLRSRCVTITIVLGASLLELS